MVVRSPAHRHPAMDVGARAGVVMYVQVLENPVDRIVPLDRPQTTVNIWAESCVIPDFQIPELHPHRASLEGELGDAFTVQDRARLTGKDVPTLRVDPLAAVDTSLDRKRGIRWGRVHLGLDRFAGADNRS